MTQHESVAHKDQAETYQPSHKVEQDFRANQPKQNRTATVTWVQRIGVWIGIAFNPGVMTAGGGVATMLPLSRLLIIMFIGAILLTTIVITHGIICRRLRHPLAKRAAAIFGQGIGAYVLNILIAFGMVGWVGFFIGITGVSLGNVLQIEGWWSNWVGALIMATALFIFSAMGMNRWNVLVWITTSAAVGVAIITLIAVGAPAKLSEILAQDTIMPENQFAAIIWIITSVVTYGILFSLRIGDFTWDLRSDRDVIYNGLCLFFPLCASLSIGAILYNVTGDWNIPDILAPTDLALLGQVFLLVSVIAPVMGSMISGALALQTLNPFQGDPNPRMQLWANGLICVIGFLLGATRFDYNLLPMIDLLGAILPPALVVLLVTSALKQKPPTSHTLAAWWIGAAVALVFKLQGQLIHIAVGAVVAIAVLAVLHLMRPRFVSGWFILRWSIR
ncbi:MAG: hypothetical protein AAF639_33235, partial [Chloroflexota bacterium]